MIFNQRRCLNKTRLRPWDRFPVVVKTDGKELQVKKREERLGRLDPQN